MTGTGKQLPSSPPSETHIHQTMQLNVSHQDNINPQSVYRGAKHDKCSRVAAEWLKNVSLKVNNMGLILGQGEVSSLLFQQLLFGG